MRRSEGQWRPECDREMSNETNYWPESQCSPVSIADKIKLNGQPALRFHSLPLIKGDPKILLLCDINVRMKSEVHYGFTNVSYNTKISLYLATP